MAMIDETAAATKATTGAPVPGPRAPRIAQTLAGVFAPYPSRRRLRARYGPVFETNDALVGRLVHIADRALVEEMFKWKPDRYLVGAPREKIMGPVTGPQSILLLDGDPHLRMRRLMLPPFHGEAIAGYEQQVTDIVDRAIDRWTPGETIRTRTVGQDVTLEVIIRVVFGVNDADRVARLTALLPRLSGVNPLLMLAKRDLGPFHPWSRFLAVRGDVDEMLFDEIARRRSGDEAASGDVLALLLAARDEDGQPLSDDELRDELVTLLLAGNETTATQVGWTFERLLRTPSALARLTDEVRSGDGGDYLDAVIKESLRLRPVVPEVFRMPAEEIELGGRRYPPGAQLCASMYLVQTDPALYGPDPLAFRPERFLEGAPEPYSWVPYGGGVRRCLGAAFAELEMRIVIGRILERATLTAPRRRPESARFAGVTVMPSRGGEARVAAVRPA